jgi:branched-chain amino acid transport system substrate-binding protein
MKSNRGFSMVLFFFLSAGLLVGFQGTAFSQSSYKIGYANSHSGFMAFMGTSWRDGFLLAADTINASGGINGRKLDVVIYDDESDVAKGVLAFKKLIETDQVLMVAGMNHSGVSIACAPIAEKAKVPFFGVGASRWIVAKPGKWKLPADPTEVYEWVFKPRVDAQPHVEAMYAFMKKQGYKKFAWMSAGTAFGRGAKEIMEATYKQAGMELVAAEEYGPNDSDMTSQLTRIKGKNFDFILIYAAETAGALAYKQARELGITKPIIADAPIVSTAILSTLGQYLGGLIVCVHIPDIPDLNALPKQVAGMGPVIAKVRKGMMEKHKKAGDWINAQGYDGALLVADALKRANPDPAKLDDSRAKIRQALASTKGFVGAYFMGDMSQYHEIPVPVVMIKVGKDQKFEVVE